MQPYPLLAEIVKYYVTIKSCVIKIFIEMGNVHDILLNKISRL